ALTCEQDAAPPYERHQGQPDLPVLALDDPFDVLLDGAEAGPEPLPVRFLCPRHHSRLPPRILGHLTRLLRCSGLPSNTHETLPVGCPAVQSKTVHGADPCPAGRNSSRSISCRPCEGRE